MIIINTSRQASTIADTAKLGNSGYVVDSVPFAIFSAMQASKMGITEMYRQVIATGGDTDTNASIAGQIAGVILGMDLIPDVLINRLKELKEYEWMMEIILKTKQRIG